MMIWLWWTLWWIGLHNYGSWEFPQSAACKLEPQEGQWCYSVKSKGLRTKGANGLKSSLVAGENERSQHKHADKAKRGTFFLTLPFVWFRPSVDWMLPIHFVGEGQFTLLSPLVERLIQKHCHRNTRKLFLTWAPVASQTDT